MPVKLCSVLSGTNGRWLKEVTVTLSGNQEDMNLTF